MGSSGSPVLLFHDNINFIKVIGIHKCGDEKNKTNFGTFISEIIDEINKNIELNLKDDTNQRKKTIAN